MKRASTISRLVEIGLRFIGLWPDSAYPTFYWVSYMISLVIVQYYQYAYVFTHFDLSDLWLLMDCLSFTLAYSHCFLKLVVLWRNRRIFYFILSSMDRDWKECGVNELYVSIMMNMADLSRRYSNVLITINALAAFFVSIGEHIIQSLYNRNQVGNNPRELPIKMEFSFEISRSPTFEYFLIGQFLYEFVIAYVVAMLNSLLITLVFHVSGQIDIMRHELTELSKKKYDHSTSLANIKGLICRHQNIIMLSENIENLFSFIALMQLLWNTWVICCTAFVIIITFGAENSAIVLMKSVSFYIAITAEAFIFCFAGEFLSSKSKSISYAIYESLWYNMSPTNTRVLLFMMLRSQKRLTITAGKIVDLSLESFTSLMKASASYASVLNAMY